MSRFKMFVAIWVQLCVAQYSGMGLLDATAGRQMIPQVFASNS